jgi:hypothetical protein
MYTGVKLIRDLHIKKQIGKDCSLLKTADNGEGKMQYAAMQHSLLLWARSAVVALGAAVGAFGLF